MLLKRIFQIAVGLGVLSLAACSLPGMQYEQGGSPAWQGTPGKPGYHAVGKLQVQQITPHLLVKLARARVNRGRLHKVANTGGNPPWVYHVGVGDVLSVIVWDHPELTNPAGTTMSVESSGRVVRPNGTMFYPHAGVLHVAGKTTGQIRRMITKALAPTIKNPQVDVRVLDFASQFVNVVGDVEQPCRLPITNVPMTVIQALDQCKTIRPAVGERGVVLEHDGNKHAVNLYAIYRGNSPLLTQPLVGGDTLYVKDDRWNRVFVIGEVNQQGALNIPVSGLTLADALNSSGMNADGDKGTGGLDQSTVDARNIYVFRGGITRKEMSGGKLSMADFKPQVYHLNAKSPDALLLAEQFRLQPRDIVFASSASLVSYSRTAARIIPTISTLIQAGILINRN